MPTKTCVCSQNPLNSTTLQDHGLLAPGSVVLADNVLCPGAPDYLHYVRSSLKYSSRFYSAHLEYTLVPDGLERSVYQEDRWTNTSRD